MYKKFYHNIINKVFLVIIILSGLFLILPTTEIQAVPTPICDIDIIFIMDRSGSMGYDHPTRLSEAKSATNNFISKLKTSDQSGLVSYSTLATLDKTLSNDHGLTQTNVNSLVATGATNIGDAINLMVTEFASPRVNPLASKIAILLTDGKANKPNGPGYGEDPADVLYAEAQAQAAANGGITIFTIGLGSNINAAMLENIASSTGGQYYYAPTGDDLDNIYAQFTDEICGQICGNNILDPGEECDGTAGVGPNQVCLPDCTLEDLTYCGDGIKQSPNEVGSGGPNNDGYEDCDGIDGVGLNQACSPDCTLINLTYCGDGIKQSPNDALTGGPNNDGYEECDGSDGLEPNESCNQDCTISICEADLDVIFIMDRSGSMGYDWPTRLTQAKNATNNFINKLGNGDQSGLVSYSTTATLDKGLSNDHGLTQTMVNSLLVTGATNIGDAISLAITGFNNANPQAAKIAILLTDGKANKPNGPGYGEDPADVAYAESKAQEAANAGITIFTIGLGSNINAAMLENIASSTGGLYYFAPTGDDLDDIYNLIIGDACDSTNP